MTHGRRAARQAGAQLGERLKAGWEWAAVLGQVEVHGWTKLDVRCCSSEGGERCLAMSGWTRLHVDRVLQ